MKAVARYSDTVTINAESNAAKNAPHHLVVTMILNDVKTTFVDGRSIAANCLKRGKPKFLVFSNSKDDCKKVMNTFNSIFTRDAITRRIHLTSSL